MTTVIYYSTSHALELIYLGSNTLKGDKNAAVSFRFSQPPPLFEGILQVWYCTPLDLALSGGPLCRESPTMQVKEPYGKSKWLLVGL